MCRDHENIDQRMPHKSFISVAQLARPLFMSRSRKSSLKVCNTGSQNSNPSSNDHEQGLSTSRLYQYIKNKNRKQTVSDGVYKVPLHCDGLFHRCTIHSSSTKTKCSYFLKQRISSNIPICLMAFLTHHPCPL